MTWGTKELWREIIIFRKYFPGFVSKGGKLEGKLLFQCGGMDDAAVDLRAGVLTAVEPAISRLKNFITSFGVVVLVREKLLLRDRHCQEQSYKRDASIHESTRENDLPEEIREVRKDEQIIKCGSRRGPAIRLVWLAILLCSKPDTGSWIHVISNRQVLILSYADAGNLKKSRINTQLVGCGAVECKWNVSDHRLIGDWFF
ncbi:hypothetical protein CDAR_67931 [Caerostris darwini]|uniref:Uncharacterized protein n=1 Tax=Caerostris darwini TaxID=1538125 RepID=A0AAV4VSI2_9ARAC|nr:hypothetical protein CDAR_67931 [Caerostris darwini]